MVNRSSAIAIVVAVIVIAIIVVAVGVSSTYKAASTTTPQATTSVGGTSSVYSGRSSSVPVMVTDPPEAPAGTSSLLVSYSSIDVHSTGTAGSGWATTSGSGTINLMNAVNSSVIVGMANLTAGSSVNLARFNLTSAKITVNGTTYNVSVPNSNLTVVVTGQSKISPDSSVLIDITPTVIALYSNNSTSFVLVPAARAVVVANATAGSSLSVGSTVSINANARAALALTAQNITITSASLSSSGSDTIVNVTVKDNSNASVTLTGLAVHGKQAITVPASAGGNATMNANMRSVLGGGYVIMGSRAQTILKVGLNIQSFMALFFMVTPSGALTLPSMDYAALSTGATVAPGQSITLTYNGNVSYNSGMFQSSIIKGGNYAITVVGMNGVRGSTIVTAG